MFKTSKECLKDDEEKKTLLIDLEPIVGKHPSIRPNFGFEKINLDLRQIPEEFLRIPNNDYIFLTKKYNNINNNIIIIIIIIN